MGKKSELSIEERTEVVLALLRKEEPVAALSRRYQVSEQTIYRWRDQFLSGGVNGCRKGRDSGGEPRFLRRVWAQKATDSQERLRRI